MNTSREEILGRIRRAKPMPPGPLATDYSAIARLYRSVGELDSTQRLGLFEERLRDYDAAVYRCNADRIADSVAQAMTAREKKSLIVPAGIPADWLPPGYVFKCGDRMTYEELDGSEGVITTCVAGIASTGTIILQHGPDQGRRAMTLIPDYHLCVVFADQVVETVPEGIHSLGPCTGLPITTVSGPSATADIEMTRVKGVHGPRHLDAIVVSR